jgi:hypothetical protein
MSRLIKSSGLISDNNNKEIMEILIDNARLFFMAGGILTFSDWLELADSEKLAFIKARESFQKDLDEAVILERYVKRAIDKLDKTIKTE